VPPTLRTRRWAFSTQAVLVLAALLVGVVLASLVASAKVLRDDLGEQYEQRALAVARSVAQQPGLAAQVVAQRPDRTGSVQRSAERVRRATDALYIVVTDAQGIRYSHPNTSLIGKRVSTSPDEALAGHEVVTIERGTLGLSARGKVPLRDVAGAVVGEVSVGIGMNEVNARTRELLVLLALFTLVPLALGLLVVLLLGRRLRRSTLGLQPEEMADLVREHAAVLGGIRDGVLAVDHQGRVTVSNPEAERLVGCVPVRGAALEESGVPPLVVDLFAREPAPAGELAVLGDRVVLVHRLVVRRDGRDLGQVLTLRDRSDLDGLARELEATRALTDALRAQAHEHRNRLHALSGLLHHGRVDEAGEYLAELASTATWVTGVEDPYLAGLLAAKAAVASEAGAKLEVDPASWVEGTLTAPLDVVTVLANLVDNAIRAASSGARRPAWVMVTLLSDGQDLVMHVVDSGDGVPSASADAVFGHGYTTRPGAEPGHGLGLPLARHTARSHGGDVVLREPSGVDHGASFEARMVRVLAPSGVAWAGQGGEA
jgi:two-component system CitB family sensor kinase